MTLSTALRRPMSSLVTSTTGFPPEGTTAARAEERPPEGGDAAGVADERVVGVAKRSPWQTRQAVPLKFTLRDDEGNFGVDPGVKLVVFDPLDSSGTRRAVYEVGEGQDSLRIDLADEQYIANVLLKNLGWVTPGAPVAVRVEAGGLVLGELALDTR